jgi:hypothetical protein
MLFAATCDRDWTNLPVRPAFLPWTYRLVGYLAQEPLGRQSFYHTGDSVPVPVSATEGLPQLLVRRPDGSTGNAGTSSDPSKPLAFDDTADCGIYRMHPPGKPADGQVFVVNLEAYESDLTPLEDVLAERDGQAESSVVTETIERAIKDVLLPGRPLVTYVNNPTRIGEASLTARRGWKLWDLALLVALAVALFEPWFANSISLRRYFKPREIAQPPMPGGRLRISGNGRPASETTPAERPAQQVG